MFKAQLVASKRIIFVFLSLYFLNACTFQAKTAELRQLRITNSSDTDIIDLVVLFPGLDENLEAYRVEFGDIPAGQTTEYKDVPSGVYKYAAYEYTLDNHLVSQFVTDWVGESPMVGSKFTYQIRLDLNKVEGDQITLVEVVVDEP